MQNSKIKRMSHNRLGEWLEAIEFVLSHYEKKQAFVVCPFCIIVDRKEFDMFSCIGCLWLIFEGKDCMNFMHEVGYTSWVSKIRNKKRWRELRIPMLRRWKKILKIELARRDE